MYRWRVGVSSRIKIVRFIRYSCSCNSWKIKTFTSKRSKERSSTRATVKSNEEQDTRMNLEFRSHSPYNLERPRKKVLGGSTPREIDWPPPSKPQPPPGRRGGGAAVAHGSRVCQGQGDRGAPVSAESWGAGGGLEPEVGVTDASTCFFILLLVFTRPHVCVSVKRTICLFSGPRHFLLPRGATFVGFWRGRTACIVGLKPDKQFRFRQFLDGTYSTVYMYTLIVYYLVLFNNSNVTPSVV